MNTLITPGTVNETMPKTVDPNESRSEWVTLSNRTSLFFWSIDGQDELRELETYSDAPMPLIDIAGVYIISDKRQKQLRSSVSDLSQWSQLVFVSFFFTLLTIYCTCLFIYSLWLVFLPVFLLLRSLVVGVCVCQCVSFCAPPPPASGWKCSRDFSPLSHSQWKQNDNRKINAFWLFFLWFCYCFDFRFLCFCNYTERIFWYTSLSLSLYFARLVVNDTLYLFLSWKTAY